MALNKEQSWEHRGGRGSCRAHIRFGWMLVLVVAGLIVWGQAPERRVFVGGLPGGNYLQGTGPHRRGAGFEANGFGARGRGDRGGVEDTAQDDEALGREEY